MTATFRAHAPIGRASDTIPRRRVKRRPAGRYAVGRRVGNASRSALALVRALLRLLPGVAFALAGLAITGGSFGMLAFIGMPLLIVGLGLITAYLPT